LVPPHPARDQSDLPRNFAPAYNREKAGLPLISGPNMPENTRVEEIVRNAVNHALERQMESLRESVVKEVLREMGSTQAGKTAPAESGSATLQKAVLAIQSGTNQKEILRALLDNTVLYSERAALFVIKAGAATGWQGTSFSHNDAIKDFSLDVSSGLAARVMQSRTAESGSTSEIDRRFIAKFGAPSDGNAMVLPLLLKDKISALVYADAGPDGGTFDDAALDVLVRATSAWLEVISQRKQAHKEGSPEASHSAPASNDPFATHVPVHSAKAQHASEAAATAPAAAMSAAAAWGGPTSPAREAHAAEVPAAEVLSPEDAETHRKAQRFARLLMDEIKLYNQAKVSEGRKHKDLYDRLKEDIEKSRQTYHKRYGTTAAGAADYFNQELIRSLAEDNVSLLGNNFRR
jgi:hypothetical protein